METFIEVVGHLFELYQGWSVYCSALIDQDSCILKLWWIEDIKYTE